MSGKIDEFGQEISLCHNLLINIFLLAYLLGTWQTLKPTSYFEKS